MTLYTQSSGDGPDLVLIHGWGLNGGIWDALAPRLAASGFRVTRVDLPGHGRSAWHGEADVDALARAVLACVPQRAAWLGWSMGALVAMRAALNAPARIARLVLVAATPSFIRRPDWTPAMAPELLEGFASDLQRDYLRTLQRFLALQVRGSDAAEAVLRELRVRLLQHGRPAPESLRAGLDILRETDLRAPLADIACPVLWLMGARDTLVPEEAARQAAGRMPDARVEVIAGAGHAPFLARPAETADIIGDFLRPSWSEHVDERHAV
jgi:pimeloyl-[acyl-carrier protein] methyl ester esterase